MPHPRIDPEDTEEDALISGWIPAAYLAIEGKTFRGALRGPGRHP